MRAGAPAIADRSDPAARAAARVAVSKVRESATRVAAAVALLLLAMTVLGAAAAPGAVIGGAVAALLCVGLAVAVWPQTWSPEERRHRELEAIWRELRADADASVAWERYAVWAEAHGHAVELSVICCAPATTRCVGGAPSPYSLEKARRLEASDIEAAANAMEQLRERVAEREERTRSHYEQARLRAERVAYERALQAVDAGAERELRARERALTEELARQEAAERRAQAEALARALRRP
jgi:hypothetical protein